MQNPKQKEKKTKTNVGKNKKKKEKRKKKERQNTKKQKKMKKKCGESFSTFPICFRILVNSVFFLNKLLDIFFSVLIFKI